MLITAGATGYLVKGPDLRTFAPAVRTVAQGQLYLGPIITEQMRWRFGSVANAMRHVLEDDDLQVLRLLAQGKTNQQIAQLLFICPKAVEKRLNNLFACLDVENRTQAAVRAVVSGLVLQQHTTRLEERWREQ